MKEVLFHWLELEGEPINVPSHATTGLMVIPGCEQRVDRSYPPGVLFNGARYHSFAIGPYGFIVLGNRGTYDQKLSEGKLYPATDQPVIIPFGEYLQVKG